ncbi:pentatricopeptide repeat-containing protein [Corchorus olitorius]|uniref:Pentatricopeptide repeat-containing protein n=1 Tax=Corchorus olitorius TaxID=93759 RepID=A0A1R3HTG1_9ROSI|nr:pentatricopeptide repeat-containing protein [Corchorus olitorius]
MAFDVAAKIHRKTFENGFFINTPSCNPLVLIITSNTLFQFIRKLSVSHPLFCISPSNPPFFKSNGCRLQICLSM